MRYAPAMIDRWIAVASLLTVGLAAGWFLHVLVTPAAKPAPTPTPAPQVQPTPDTPTVGDPTNTGARQEVFDDIYRNAKWGTNTGSAGTSGFGSMLSTTLVYRTFLQQFMKDAQIKSVVDAGCGDWEFSQAMDWTGIDYKGYDIVGSVVDRDTKMFGKPNIQFFKGDIVEDDLPPADLLISKDVLQHLPNADVLKFLTKQVPKYKHVLLVNGTGNHSLSARNVDIKLGEYRTLDLANPPFNLHGLKVLTYWDGANMHQAYYIARPPPPPPDSKR
jgi:SAM-dependent methyltransferase